VTHQNHARAACAQLLDRGQCRANAGVVAHDAVLVNRHVQVDAYQYASTLDVTNLRESPPRHT
jgi:hypothetical protein